MPMMGGRSSPPPIDLRELYFGKKPGMFAGRGMSKPDRYASKVVNDFFEDHLRKVTTDRRASKLAKKLTGIVELWPGFTAGQSLRKGKYVEGGIDAALNAIPGASLVKAAGKGVKTATGAVLDFPSQLNRPRNPTLDEMRRLSSLVDVPLAQARLGNGLDWDQFGKVSPWLDEYADSPIAAQLENGEYVLMDGNHRAALALQDGREAMPMHVIPARQYDPQNAGRASRQPSAEETDRLLAELTRP